MMFDGAEKVFGDTPDLCDMNVFSSGLDVLHVICVD